MKLIILIIVFCCVNIFSCAEMKGKHTCDDVLNCPCGKKGFFNFFIDMCYFKRSNGVVGCKPCDDGFIYSNPCEKFVNCETCSSTELKCLTCPIGWHGLLCNERNKSAILLSRESLLATQLSNHNKSPELTSIGKTDAEIKLKTHGCDVPEHFNTIWTKCKYSEDRVRCGETCIWGYTFDGNQRGPTYLIVECHYSRKTWEPNFRECIRAIPCSIELKSPGSIQCTHHQLQVPDICNISCSEGDSEDGEYSVPFSSYTCQEDGSYKPPLPYCVEKSNYWPKEINESETFTKTTVRNLGYSDGDYKYNKTSNNQSEQDPSDFKLLWHYNYSTENDPPLPPVPSRMPARVVNV